MTTTPRKQIILAAYVGGRQRAHRCGSTPTRAARSSSTRSATSRRPPSAAGSTTSSSPRASRCASAPGKVFDHDIAGRPDTLPVLAALAAVTEHIGLVGTINATFNEPYELARQLSEPRPPVGRPCRLERRDELGCLHRAELPPRRLPHPRGALRAGRGVRPDTVRELWDSWAEDAIVADKADRASSSRMPRPAPSRAHRRAVRHRGPLHRAAQPAGATRSSCRRASRRRAGTSPRRTRTSSSRRTRACPRRGTSTSTSSRAPARYGRNPDRPEDHPGRRVRARRLARGRRRRRRATSSSSSSPTAPSRCCSSSVWNRRPLGVRHRRPAAGHRAGSGGRADHPGSRVHLPGPVRDGARAGASSPRPRDLTSAASPPRSRRARTSSAPRQQVAEGLDDFIQNDGADGVVLGGHFTPGGLDEFVDTVVPLLQERGSLRTEYDGSHAAREPRPADPRAPGALAATV